MDVLPPIRQDIDIVPIRQEEGSFLLVRDQLGIVEHGLVLDARIAQLLPFFDGTTPVSELQLALTRQTGGVIVPSEQIGALVEQLDHIGLLQTDRYRRSRDEIVAEFSRRAEREATLASSAYPARPEELASEIDRLLRLAESPTSGEAAASPPCAVAAPHIDLGVAGASYGHAYRGIRHLSPTAILLLGTGHSLESPYCLTDKNFVTPLGRVPADREAVQRLRDAGGGAVSGNDFAHRSEHSIEFQLLFLQRIFDMEKVPIVPLLCGSLEPFLLLEKGPQDDPDVSRFVGALKQWYAEPPAGKLVVAGVDLAHVGPKFGDEQAATVMEPSFRASDARLLQALEEGDADGFYSTVAETGNRFKICGFSALWTLLSMLPGARGKTLDYRVWHEERTQSAVSFAAVTFTMEPALRS